MLNPPKPGVVLAEYLGGLSSADAASKIGIGQEHLSRLITGDANIDPKLAAKLARAFGTSTNLWTGLQSAFDAWMESAVVRDKSVRDLKGMFSAPPGKIVSIEDMHRGLLPEDDAAWENLVPVGGEFGSLDYERLAELDHLAFKATGTLQKARRWLDTPHAALNDLTPEEVAKTPEGFTRVRRLLGDFK